MVTFLVVIAKCPTRKNGLKEQGFIPPHGLRGFSLDVSAGAWGCRFVPLSTRKQNPDRKQAKLQTQRCYTVGPLFLVRLYFWKGSQLPKTASSSEDHVFKHTSLWETFHKEGIKSGRVMGAPKHRARMDWHHHGGPRSEEIRMLLFIVQGVWDLPSKFLDSYCFFGRKGCS